MDITGCTVIWFLLGFSALPRDGDRHQRLLALRTRRQGVHTTDERWTDASRIDEWKTKSTAWRLGLGYANPKGNDSRFGIENGTLTIQNAKAMQTHELKRSVVKHSSDGVWFHEGKGELIIADDGKKTWVIHIPISPSKPLFTKQNGKRTH